MDSAEKICRTCKHWESPLDSGWVYFNPDQILGQCQKGTPDRHEERYGPLMAAVCESEMIGGELITDERFGCILHEAKT